MSISECGSTPIPPAKIENDEIIGPIDDQNRATDADFPMRDCPPPFLVFELRRAFPYGLHLFGEKAFLALGVELSLQFDRGLRAGIR